MENCKANHILDISSHRRCFVRKDVLTNFANSQENTYVRVSLYQGIKPAPLLKRDSSASVFLGILQNFVNRVSDYYVKSIYIKVFLWKIVLWMLVPSKEELAKILKTANSFEVTYYKCGAGLQPGTSPVVSFSRIFSIHFVSSKIRPPVLYSYKLTTFNSNW